MMTPKYAALFAALVAACTVKTGNAPERHEFTRGGVGEDAGPIGAADAGAGECVLHSDCEDGLACVDGVCTSVEPGTPDAGAPDGQESESEAEAESESESEAEAEAEADASAPDASVPPETSDAGAPASDAAAPSPDAGAVSEPDAAASAPDAGAPIPDASAPDAAPPIPTTVVIEVPAGESTDASARFCSTFGGGWACAPFVLGGTSGREIRATFADVAPTQHVFNACLRVCEDSVNGAWMAYQSDGLQQRDDPDVFVGDVVVPEALVSNGGLGANWSVDLRNSADAGPDGG